MTAPHHLAPADRAVAVETWTVCVVGGGLMGSGIAEVPARHGHLVHVVEADRAAAERTRQRIDDSMSTAIARGKLSAVEGADAQRRIEIATRIADLPPCDLAIEAVVEDPDIKAGIFAELDVMFPGNTIIASNTSSVPIAQLAAATKRPDRVCGLHFFSPAPVMRLVEVVDALLTSPATIDAVTAFVRSIEKVPIRTKDRSGFIVNMLLVPYLVAAIRMFEDGFASAEAIDTGMRLGCGYPMGPLALCDLIGLDVLFAICTSLYEEFKQPEYAPPPLLKRMVAAGLLGRKAGIGFFPHE